MGSGEDEGDHAPSTPVDSHGVGGGGTVKTEARLRDAGSFDRDGSPAGWQYKEHLSNSIRRNPDMVGRIDSISQVVGRVDSYMPWDASTLQQMQATPASPGANSVVDVKKYIGDEAKRRWFHFIPLELAIWNWLPKYEMENLGGDVVAGVSVGIMVIPQGLAHAAIAGAPLVMGLYAALVPLYTYAVLGSSRHMAVGSGAVVSLLINSAIADLPAPGDNGLACREADGTFDVSIKYCDSCIERCAERPGRQFGFETPGNGCVDRCLEDLQFQASITLAFLSGGVQVLGGLLRVGNIVNFLSGPVLEGFTVAAGITIMVGQLKHFFGLDKAKYNEPCAEGGWLGGPGSFSCVVPRTYATLLQTVGALDTTSGGDVAVGAAMLLLLVVGKEAKGRLGKVDTWLGRLGKQVASFVALWVVVTSTVWSYYMRDTNMSVKTVGVVPDGLPGFRTPLQDDDAGHLAQVVVDMAFPSLAIAIVGFITSIAVGKQVAARKGYRVDGSQELVALGAANLVGSFFGAFVTQGSLSRTALNAQTANTQLASIISASVVLVGLLVLLPLVEFLPKAALAAIIIMACRELVDLSALKTLYSKGVYREAGVLLFALFVTLVFGAQTGLAASIMLSITLVVKRVATPPCGEMGRLPGSINYSRVETAESSLTYVNVVIFEFESAIFFVNKEFFLDQLHLVEERAGALRGPIKHLIINMAMVTYIDSSGVRVVQEVIASCKRRGTRLVFVSLSQMVKDEFWRWGIARDLGGSAFYLSLQDAVEDAVAALAEEHERERRESEERERERLQLAAPSATPTATPTGTPRAGAGGGAVNPFLVAARGLVGLHLDVPGSSRSLGSSSTASRALRSRSGIDSMLITQMRDDGTSPQRTLHPEDIFPSVFDSWQHTAERDDRGLLRFSYKSDEAIRQEEAMLAEHAKLERPDSVNRRRVYEAFTQEDMKYLKALVRTTQFSFKGKKKRRGSTGGVSTLMGNLRAGSVTAPGRPHSGPLAVVPSAKSESAAGSGRRGRAAARSSSIAEAIIEGDEAPGGSTPHDDSGGGKRGSARSTSAGSAGFEGAGGAGDGWGRPKKKGRSNHMLNYRATAGHNGERFVAGLVASGRPSASDGAIALASHRLSATDDDARAARGHSESEVALAIEEPSLGPLAARESGASGTPGSRAEGGDAGEEVEGGGKVAGEGRQGDREP